MIGTILNAVGIVAGGLYGLTGRQISPARQNLIRSLIGTFVVYAGLRLMWVSIGGGGNKMVKQVVILFGALILGKIVGRMLGLQKLSNRIGTFARERMERIKPGTTNFNDGFLVCTALACLNPLALTGSLYEGINYQWSSYPYSAYPLGAKAVMDGLAMMVFVQIFGRGAILSVVPVVALQGLLWLTGRAISDWLEFQALFGYVNSVLGMLFVSAALVIFETKKIELANYLPSLPIAALLGWWWR